MVASKVANSAGLMVVAWDVRTVVAKVALWAVLLVQWLAADWVASLVENWVLTAVACSVGSMAVKRAVAWVDLKAHAWAVKMDDEKVAQTASQSAASKAVMLVVQTVELTVARLVAQMAVLLAALTVDSMVVKSEKKRVAWKAACLVASKAAMWAAMKGAWVSLRAGSMVVMSAARRASVSGQK